MAAPTIPLGRGTLPSLTAGGASSASQVSLPSMFAAELEGQLEPEVQPWEWVFANVWRKSSDAPPLHLLLADTIMAAPNGELLQWFFTAKNGEVKKKNADKSCTVGFYAPTAVREKFEREALAGAFNVGRYTTVVRRSGGAKAQLLDETTFRDMTKENGDLSGILALQLYVHAKGGNATRYVCNYMLERKTRHLRATVHKRVYMGADGVSSHRQGNDVAEPPRCATLPSYGGMLNEHIIQMTRDLCQRLELHSRHTVLHMNAQFILDENEHAWFVGASEIVTIKQPAVVAPREVKERHVPVNPTLQCLAGEGRMREAVCMGDYCKVAQLRSTSDKLKSSTGLQRSVAKGGPDLTRSNASLVSGASLGDLVTQSDGTVMSLAEVVEGNGRKKSSMMPAIKLGDGEDDEDGAADGAADEADTSEQSFATRGLAAALAETAAAAPTHRIAYRAILLDRTLRGLGIEEDDPSPPGVLQQFEAKTRRRMDLYYHQAHVCAACAQWYERQSRRRAKGSCSRSAMITGMQPVATASYRRRDEAESPRGARQKLERIIRFR